jgi:hypothetical protein
MEYLFCLDAKFILLSARLIMSFIRLLNLAFHEQSVFWHVEQVYLQGTVFFGTKVYCATTYAQNINELTPSPLNQSACQSKRGE